MATYYKYKSREGEDQIDWRGITQGITDDLTKIATDRENKRQVIDEAVLTNLETIADKPQGQDAGQNQIIANYAEQASSIALANQKLLKSGAITLKEYTARTNTAGSSTTKLFSLSKKYQENFKRHMDSLKADENGIVQGSGLGAVFLKQVETFSNPNTTRYYMDPSTGEAFLAKVGDQGVDGKVATIDGQAYSLMNVGAAGDIISRDVNRYQSNSIANNLAEQAGAYVKVIMTGDVKTEDDAFKRMFALDDKGNIKEDGITEEGKSVLSQIRASFASDMDYASMLYDTLGKEPISKDTKGEGYTNILTGKKYTGKVTDAILFDTVNGQQQPQLTPEQKKEAEMGVIKQIRTKLDIKETARTDQLDERRVKDAEKRTELQRLRDEKGKETVTSTIMADAKSYLEKNILLKDLEQSDDADVIKSINNILSEFGISISNPTNLFDGQSIRLTQVNADGKEVTEEILLPSDKSRDILLTNAPSSNAAKQSIITFILENVNARSLSALKNKLSPAPQETETEIDDPLGLLEP
tara:strand:- start:198 stop:1781 length:1584 start_codon:yes stop_codon:yes gene_type:complete